MTREQIVAAARQAWANLDRCNTFDAGVKREMCDILSCQPWELEAVLTDDVIMAAFGY